MENQVDVRVLVFDKDDRILLVLERGGPRTRPDGQVFQKPSMWGIPGGRSEPEDKNEIDTAVREVYEETGYWVGLDVLKIERQKEGYSKVMFTGYPVAGAIKINPEEILDCRWFPRTVLYDERFDIYNTHRAMAKELLVKRRK